MYDDECKCNDMCMNVVTCLGSQVQGVLRWIRITGKRQVSLINGTSWVGSTVGRFLESQIFLENVTAVTKTRRTIISLRRSRLGEVFVMSQ